MNTIKQEIAALRQRLADLEAKLVASEAPAGVDWSTVKPGTLVEVRDADTEEWLPAFLNDFDVNDRVGHPFLVDFVCGPVNEWYPECRLAKDVPSIMFWFENTGVAPDVPEGTLVATIARDGRFIAGDLAGNWFWGLNGQPDNILKYAIIPAPE